MPPNLEHTDPDNGQNGAVVTNHPQATAAGVDVLRSGGNAFDAGRHLTLGVVEPAMFTWRDGFYHVCRCGENSVYNGTGSAPKAACRNASTKPAYQFWV